MTKKVIESKKSKPKLTLDEIHSSGSRKEYKGPQFVISKHSKDCACKEKKMKSNTQIINKKYQKFKI